MILSQLIAQKDAYKESLARSFEANRYAWESLKTFSDNWETNALDFSSMYARSFENNLSNPLWEGHEYFPKRAMLELIGRDEDLIRRMFQELFNEKLDIEGRVDRFVYHCDALRDDMRRDNPKYQRHYHGGYRMISVYLTFKYPGHYCIYDYPAWRYFMEAIGAKPIPEEHEIGRFFKVARTIWKIISKDEELLELHRRQRQIHRDIHQNDSLLIVWELYTRSQNRTPVPDPLKPL